MTEAEVQTAFGTGDGQLGFSILRLRIAPDPEDWAASVPSAQAAQAMGVTVIASPWSPPASMKTSDSTVGGRLRDDMYDAYAAHLAAFDAYMEDNGVDVYAISIQNEPDIEVSYESCDWTPEEVRRFMAEGASAIVTRVIAPESFQFRHGMSDPTLNDPVAASHLDIVGGHIYGGGLEPYPLARDMGKEVWMTEHLTESQHSADIWSLALEVGEEIQQVMLADMSAYIWWYIVRYYGPIADGEVSAQNPEEPFGAKGDVTKKGYVMSQFSRFIRPGFVRVHTDRPTRFSAVSATAYRSGSDLVMVAVNRSSSPQEVSLVLDGGTAERFRRYVTSETQNVEPLADAVVSDGTLVATLGPSSVTTFVSEDAVVSTETSVGDAVSLAQNHPNPFGAGPTTLTYTLATGGPVRLAVYDALGREVATLVDGTRAAGRHEVTFDGIGLPSGVYTARLGAGGRTVWRRMVLAR